MVTNSVSATTSHSEMKLNFVLVVFMAFLCAIVIGSLNEVKAKRSISQWLIEKKQTAIACSPGEPNSNSSLPTGQKNGNGCAHQTGATCTMINSKFDVRSSMFKKSKRSG